MNNLPGFLRNHPFAVEAFFEKSIVLTFTFQREELKPLIPACLTLDTFEDQQAFMAVAFVQTRDLRPKSFPKFMGQDFFLIGYRIFVKYTTPEGKRLRGLYILKSETDKRRMETVGNIFTHYNYTTSDIQLSEENNKIHIFSESTGFKIEVEKSEVEIPLPKNSPFRDWKEARRFAGPLPFTFTYNAKTHEVLIVEGVRKNWKPRPLKVNQLSVPPLPILELREAQLANAFIVENIPYYWKKGKVEKWKG